MPGRTSLIFDEVLRVQIRVDHRAVWEGGPSPLELIAWLIGPPLVMWAAWLWWVGRRHRREEGGVVPAARAAPPLPALDAGEQLRSPAAARPAPELVRRPGDRAD